jgi:hypothetical protein
MLHICPGLFVLVDLIIRLHSQTGFYSYGVRSGVKWYCAGRENNEDGESKRDVLNYYSRRTQ